VNAAACDGSTALHHAANNDNLAAVKLLLKNGGCRSAAMLDGDGATPLGEFTNLV
jgi:ankyrin repeat protein